MASPPDSASITTRAFASRRKGFDPDEVRAYLGQLAEVVSRLTTERDEAQGRIRGLEKAAAEAPEIDEDRLTAALGEETARVLATARHAANEMKERADERVARVLREAAEEAGSIRRDAEAAAAAARDEATRIRTEANEARERSRTEAAAEAERMRTEAEAAAEAIRTTADTEREAAQAEIQEARNRAETDAATVRSEAEAMLGVRTASAEEAANRIREQAEAEAAAIRAAAEAEVVVIRQGAEAERETGRAEGREMVAEAQRVRERMLRDLARRRKTARTQLEQLQAARDSLLEAYDDVRRTLDVSTGDLRGALTEARRAADAARVRADAEPESSVDQLEAQISAARAAGLPLVAEDDGDDAGVDPVDLAAVEHGTDAVPIESDGDDGAEPDAAVAAAESDDAPGADLPSVASERGTGSASDGPAPAVATDSDRASTVPGPTDPAEKQTDPAEKQTDPAEKQTETETAEVPVAGPVGGAAPTAAVESEPAASDAPADPAAGIDALFAQLKASREDEVAKAREVLGDTATSGADLDTAASEPTASTQADTPDDIRAADDLTVDPDGAAGDGALASLLERRDGAVEPIEQRLARKLKRTLTDEQGRVLDGIRRARGGADPARLLPIDGQVASYAEAALDELRSAAEEGADFEGGALPGDVDVSDLAEGLGSELAHLVRPRVERCFETGEDADDLSDRIRSVYREWKTQRILDGVRHLVLAAFSRGQCAVMPAGTELRWVLDETGGSCPDGADNALAGAIVAGQPFPTGHTHPPAHPGCRCLIVSARTIAPVGAGSVG